jgi:RNA polymerase-binding transcription factor DksA
VRKETNLLEAERDKLKDQIARLEQALEAKPDYGIGEGDPAITRWQLNRALLEQHRERLTKLESALSNAKQGEYGICERCGEPIHPDRLAVLPGVTMCVRCAKEREQILVQ